MAEESRRVLVVDDMEAVQAGIRRMLESGGYAVDSALSAAQGLELLERNAYRAVIVDLLLPGTDGLEFLEEMRRRRINLPAIMITSYPTIKSAVKALRLGAVDYIPKPFTRQEILAPLDRALSRGECAWGACELEHETPPSFVPGKKFILPKHSWARLREDGTVEVGLQGSFLDPLPPLKKIRGLAVDDLVEQGHPGPVLIGRGQGQVHRAFMPLSGRIVELNREVLDDPSALGPETWLVRILPHNLEEELANLRPGEE